MVPKLAGRQRRDSLGRGFLPGPLVLAAHPDLLLAVRRLESAGSCKYMHVDAYKTQPDLIRPRRDSGVRFDALRT